MDSYAPIMFDPNATGVFAVFNLLFSLMFSMLFFVGDVIRLVSSFANSLP